MTDTQQNMTAELLSTWNDQYLSAEDTALKDRNLFSLEVAAILQQIGTYLQRRASRPTRILELGCGTGYLVQRIAATFGKSHSLSFTAVDFSPVAINKALARSITNATFLTADVSAFLAGLPEQYDIVLTQRSVMAIVAPMTQRALLTLLNNSIAEGGLGLFSECIQESYDRINSLRLSLGVRPLEKVWHCRYLVTEELQQAFSRFQLVDFCSTYYLITRIIYPYFDDPQHNTALADFAAALPQEGDLGLLKLVVVQR